LTQLLRPFALLLIAGIACSCSGKKKAEAKPDSATPNPPLTAQAIRALLYDCEARAQQGDVVGFRACLTKKSSADLDRFFRNSKTALDTVLKQAVKAASSAATLKPELVAALGPQLAQLGQQRAAAKALLGNSTWKVHLALIARAPRAGVEKIEQKGDRATFHKRVGKTTTRHYLAREGGTWRIDLATNPDFKKRAAAVASQVNAVMAQIRGTIAAMRKQVQAAKSAGVAPKAPRRLPGARSKRPPSPGRSRPR